MAKYHYTAAAQASVTRMLEPLKPFCSQGGARVELSAARAHYEREAIHKGAQAVHTQVGNFA